MLRAVRTRWLLTLAVAAYVFLDFSSPYVPGVFVFDADQSVDVVLMSGHGVRLDGSGPVVAAAADPVRVDEARTASPAQVRIAAPVKWLAVLRKAHRDSSDRSVLAEPH